MPKPIPKAEQIAAARILLAEGRRSAPPEYVAYYRVSTDRQGEHGLGMDAQREAVVRLIQAGKLAAEYTEVESGRRHRNRPQLAAALDLCRRRKATLVIAKLDRLARNVHFISGLMESGVEFLAADMPHANKLTVHIMAAFAEHEREAISQRTSAALRMINADLAVNGQRVSKVSGRVYTKLGNPRIEEARKAAAETLRSTPATEVIQIMRDRRSQGDTYRQIAASLNSLDIRTPRGSRWHPGTVRTQLERHK